MKRMIECEKCSERLYKNYPNEWAKRIKGIALKDMFCDWCYPPTLILKGDKCAAASMGVYGHGIPYYEWESEFIDAAREKGKE